MISDFPQEIIDEILSYHTGDIRTLRACSVVSSSFRGPSQRSLFYAIVLDLKETAKTFRLYRALSNNPILASYICSVFIILCVSNDTESVCDVLRSLKNVQELLLGNRPTIFNFVGWQHIPETLKDCVLNILHQPICRSLILGEVSFPVKHLRELAHLQHLQVTYIDSIGFGDDDHRHGARNRQESQQRSLESLALRTPEVALCLLKALRHNPRESSSLSLSQPHFCALESVHQGGDEVQTILDLAQKHLRLIYIGIHLDRSGNFLDFSNLMNLRILGICILGTRVLAALPSRIEELEIRVASAIEDPNAEEWTESDTQLTQPHHVSTLRCVVFWIDGQVKEEVARRFLRGNVPGLVQKEFLVI